MVFLCLVFRTILCFNLYFARKALIKTSRGRTQSCCNALLCHKVAANTFLNATDAVAAKTIDIKGSYVRSQSKTELAVSSLSESGFTDKKIIC